MGNFPILLRQGIHCTILYNLVKTEAKLNPKFQYQQYYSLFSLTLSGKQKKNCFAEHAPSFILNKIKTVSKNHYGYPPPQHPHIGQRSSLY